MPRTPRKTNLREHEYVRIPIKGTAITLFGEIKHRKDGQTVFSGIADGLTAENYHQLSSRHEISGYSSKNGNIWLKDLIFRQATTYGDSTLGAAKVIARTMYMGDFDPRAEPIKRAAIELPTSIWLSDRTIKEQQVDHSTKSIVITAPLQVESIKLFSDENVSITIDHLGRFSEQIDYQETLFVEFENSGTSEEADLLLDALCLLVSVLTQAHSTPTTRTYSKAGDDIQKTKRYSWIEKRTHTNFYDWLALPGKILELLKQLLPHWISAVRDPNKGMLIRHFVSAANKKGYVESDFLAFCQCFEGLSTQRIGSHAGTSECSIQVFSQLNEVAKQIGLNTTFRRRIRKAFDDANRWTLQDRLKKTFTTNPFCIQEVMRRRPDVYAEIARRRNQLSHGSTDGIIRTQIDFEQLLTETAVVRALCLAEVLLLVGMPEEQVAEIIRHDIVMRYLRVR